MFGGTKLFSVVVSASTSSTIFSTTSTGSICPVVMNSPIIRKTSVADALTAHGFAAHADQRNNQLRIINNHCPFGDVAIEHPVICAVDRGMVRGMLGALHGDADVSTVQSMAQGDTFCATSV